MAVKQNELAEVVNIVIGEARGLVNRTLAFWLVGSMFVSALAIVIAIDARLKYEHVTEKYEEAITYSNILRNTMVTHGVIVPDQPEGDTE